MKHCYCIMGMSSTTAVMGPNTTHQDAQCCWCGKRYVLRYAEKPIDLPGHGPLAQRRFTGPYRRELMNPDDEECPERPEETPAAGEKCANCGARAFLRMDNGDMLCGKCADILIAPFRSQKWRDSELAKRRGVGALVVAAPTPGLPTSGIATAMAKEWLAANKPEGEKGGEE